MWLREGTKALWQLYAATDAGTVRKVDQDNFYLPGCVALQNGNKRFYEVKKECADAVLAAVCDGMGGESRGELASYLACSTLQEVDAGEITGLSTEAVLRYLENLLTKMNEAVYQGVGATGNFGGCTATLLYADTVRTVVLNVGDSPCFRYYLGNARLVTVPDNQANRMYQRGEIGEEERWHHAAKSRLTQCLGEDPKEIAIVPHSYVAAAMKPGESYLLASDGLTDGVSPRDIIGMLQQNTGPSVALALAEAAKAGGSRDNITALLVKRKV